MCPDSRRLLAERLESSVTSSMPCPEPQYRPACRHAKANDFSYISKHTKITSKPRINRADGEAPLNQEDQIFTPSSENPTQRYRACCGHTGHPLPRSKVPSCVEHDRARVITNECDAVGVIGCNDVEDVWNLEHSAQPEISKLCVFSVRRGFNSRRLHNPVFNNLRRN